MPDQYRSGDKFRDISAIDSRLAELEQEKQQLIALRAELLKSKPVPPISDFSSPEQKIAFAFGAGCGRHRKVCWKGF